MKIGLQTWGSDGDILPFMALAEGLSAAGHQVNVAYTSVDNKDYSGLSQEAGFSSFRAHGDFEVGVHEALEEIVRTNDPMRQFVRVMETFFDPAVQAMYDASRRLCAESDLVVGHMMCHTLLTAAQKAALPRVSVALAPLAIRTSAIPLFGPNLGAFWNGLTWRLADYLGAKKLFGPAQALRAKEGLAPLRSLQQELYLSETLTLVATSPTLTPRRADWPASVQVCGDWAFEDAERHLPMPEGLETFLAAGSPPVYLTFGSLAPFEAEAMDELMCSAVEMAGCRAILQSPLPLPPTSRIFRCVRTPHRRVFPACAAVVHHGGAGTTHSATRAGCPSIVVEHAFDQQFWGDELKRLGCAGPVLHRNRLSVRKLADAIRLVLDTPAMRARALQLSTAMAAENGVVKAVELIEARFEGRTLRQDRLTLI